MKKGYKKKGYKKKMLRIRVFLVFIIVALIIDAAIAGISYVMYTRNMNGEGNRICTGISEAIASTMNGNLVDDWLDEKRLNDYDATGEQLVNLMNSYADIVNIQVYKMNLDGARVIYDLSRGRDEGVALGSTIEYNSRLAGIKDDLIAGEYVGTLFTRQGTRTIITALTPVTDTANDVTCYAICEINMDTMSRNRQDFIKTLFVTMLIISFVLVIILNLYMNRTIIRPISGLDTVLRKVASGNCDSANVQEELEKIKRCSLAEVANMCSDFGKILEEIDSKAPEADEFDKTSREKMNEAIKKS